MHRHFLLLEHVILLLCANCCCCDIIHLTVPSAILASVCTYMYMHMLLVPLSVMLLLYKVNNYVCDCYLSICLSPCSMYAPTLLSLQPAPPHHSQTVAAVKGFPISSVCMLYYILHTCSLCALYIPPYTYTSHFASVDSG